MLKITVTLNRLIEYYLIQLENQPENRIKNKHEIDIYYLKLYVILILR